MQNKRILGPLQLALVAYLVQAVPAAAYIGPGAGLGGIVVAIALLLGVFLLIVGLVWYPLKRLLKGRNESPETSEADSSSDK